MLKELLALLETLEEEMDYLEYMRLKFYIQDLIAEEELKQFLDEDK